MASFTSTINGAWNDGATWGNASPGSEGTDFPGPGDTATIAAGTNVSTVIATTHRAGALFLTTPTSTLTGAAGVTIQLNDDGASATIFGNGGILAGTAITFDITGAVNRAIDFTGTSGNPGAVEINGSGTFTMSSAITASRVTINSGEIDTGGNAITVSSSSTALDTSGGGTLTANASTITISNGDLDFSSGTFSTGTSTIIMGGAGKTFTGRYSPTLFLSNLTINGNTTVAGGGGLTAFVMLGTLDNNATLDTSSSDITVQGATAMGAFDNSGGTITLTGSGDALSFQSGSGSATINNWGTINGAGVVNFTDFGSFSYTLGSALTLGGTVSMSVTLNSSLVVSGNVITVGGDTSIAGTLTCAAGGTQSHTFSGNFTVTGTLSEGDDTFNIGGDCDLGSATLNPLNGTFVMTTDGSTFTTGSNSTQFYNITLSNNITIAGSGTDPFVTNNLTIGAYSIDITRTGFGVRNAGVANLSAASATITGNIFIFDISTNTSRNVSANLPTFNNSVVKMAYLGSTAPVSMTLQSAMTGTADLTIYNDDTTDLFTVDAATFAFQMGDLNVQNGSPGGGSQTLLMGSSVGHTFTDVTITEGTLNGETSTIAIDGNLDFVNPSVVWTYGTSTIVMTSASDAHELRRDTTNYFFYNLTINGDTTVASTGGGGYFVNAGGTMSIASNKTFTNDSNNAWSIRSTAIGLFTMGSGSTFSKTASSLIFDALGTSPNFGANIDPTADIIGNLEFRGGAFTQDADIDITAGMRWTAISGVNLTWDCATFNISCGDAAIYAPSGLSTTIDLNGNDLTCDDLTITHVGVLAELDASTGSSTITVGDDIDMSTGTFTQGTSTVLITASLSTIVVGANSNTWYNFHIADTAQASIQPGSTLTVTNAYTKLGTTGTLAINGTLILADADYTNPSGCFVGGLGLVQFTLPDTGSRVYSNGGVIDVAMQFSVDGGAPNTCDYSLGSDWDMIDVNDDGTLTIDEGVTFDTLTYDLDFIGGTIDGTLQETTGGNTWTISGNTQVNTGGSFIVSATVPGTTIVGVGDAARIASTGAGSTGLIRVKGDTWANRVTVTGGKFSIESSVDVQYIEHTHAQTAGNIAWTLSSNTIGTIANASVISSTYWAMVVSNSPGVTSIEDCYFQGAGNALFMNGSTGNLTYKGCNFFSTNGWQQQNNNFTGRMENCLFRGATNGLVTTGISITQGSVVNCTFDAPAPITLNSASASGYFVGCIFDKTAVGLVAGASLISYHHNRTNAKEIFIAGDVTIDSTTLSIVNHDTFDWDYADGEWRVGGTDRNRFIATTDTGDLTSIYIPVAASTTYYLRYRGDVDNVDVLGYDIGQTADATADTGFVLSGDDYESTIVTGVNTAFIRWIANASALDEEFYDIEVRETDADGDLIWNEDLLNHYFWPASGVDYNTQGISFDFASENIVPFGDDDYTRLDAEMAIVDDIVTGDTFGFVFGYQDSSNYYEAKLIGGATNAEVEINKIVGGVSTPVDSATDYSTGTPLPVNASVASLRVTWSMAVDGAYEVWVNGTIIEDNVAGGWATGAGAGNDYSASDTTFSAGLTGIIGKGAEVDDMEVYHFGLFVFGANLTLSSGTDVTIDSDGWVRLESTVVNSTRASFPIVSGGTLIEENVTWADDSFDPNVSGIVNLKCARIAVSGDIIILPGGQLTLTGSVIEPVTDDIEWTIITEQATVTPAIIVKGCRFYGITPRIRTMALGEVYELDGRYELLLDSREPDHPMNIISTEVYGRQANRNVVKSFGDQEVTLHFLTHDDMCLFGQTRKWFDDEEQLEVVWPNGVLPDVKIIDHFARGTREDNIRIVEWDVTFREFL